MPYTGITTRKTRCAICKTAMPTGETVYFDATKSQGSHLAHVKCWDDLRATRGPKPKPKTRPVRVSDEPLDPPF